MSETCIRCGEGGADSVCWASDGEGGMSKQPIHNDCLADVVSRQRGEADEGPNP